MLCFINKNTFVNYIKRTNDYVHFQKFPQDIQKQKTWHLLLLVTNTIKIFDFRFTAWKREL